MQCVKMMGCSVLAEKAYPSLCVLFCSSLWLQQAAAVSLLAMLLVPLLSDHELGQEMCEEGEVSGFTGRKVHMKLRIRVYVNIKRG